MNRSGVPKSLERFRVVLVRTKDPRNLGMVARAMTNMGLSSLVCVAPQCEISDEAYATAAGCCEVLENSWEVPTLAQAVSDCGQVIAFTRRLGKLRRVSRAFRSRVKSWLEDARANSIALVFGPEDFGLSTDDLKLCTERIRLPTAERFPSLNLAQAVLLVSYEVYNASRGKSRDISAKTRAPSEETTALYSHMEQALVRMRYFGARNTDFGMRCFQDIFSRAALSSDEVRMWRGVFSRIIRLADRLEGEQEDPGSA